MLFIGVFLRERARPVAKSRTNVAQIQEKLPNGWTDLHQIWHTCADSCGNGYMPHKLNLNTKGAFRGGGFGVHKSQSLRGCQTAGRIGTNFGRRLWIRLGMDIS